MIEMKPSIRAFIRSALSPQGINLAVLGVLSLTFLAMMHYTINPGGSGLHLPLNIVVWGMMALLAIALYVPRFDMKEIITSPGGRWLLSGVLLMSLPGLHPESLENVSSWLPRILGLWGGIVLLLGLFRLKLNANVRQGWLLLILLSAWSQTILALLQWTVFTSNNWMEFDLAERPYGIFQQTNVLASYIATGYGIAIYLFMVSSHRIVRGLCTLTLLVFPGLLMLLHSRIGWLGGVTTLLLLSLYYWRQRQMVGLWLCSLLSLLAAYSLSDQMVDSVWISKAASNQQRGLILVYTWQMIQQHPWQGWGFDSFEPAFARELAQAGHVTKHFIYPSHPHNELLYGWVEGGIVALIGMLVLAIGYIKPLFIQPKIVFPLWVLTLPIALHLMTELPLYQSAAHWLVLILLGRLMVPETMIHPTIAKPALWQRWLDGSVVFSALFTLIFMITGWQTGRVLTLTERSGLVDMRPLDNLKNPYIQWERYQYIRHINLLLQFNKRPDPALLAQFTIWAKQYIQHHNDPNVYQSLIMIARYQNEVAQADSLLRAAQALFPDNPTFGSS